jgi:hypothetical protein
MRIRPGILIAVVTVFVILFGGRYLGWFGGKPKEVVNHNEPPVETPAPPEERSTAPMRPAGTGLRPPPTATTPSVNAVTPPEVATPPAAAGPITDWEEKIDEVLTGPEDETQKAKRLLGLFPRLPEDGQVEAAQHLSNLLPDEEYAPLAHTLTNAAMPEAVLDVLMTDVLNRPNQVKLETLLGVARTPNHPKAEEARDVLEVFVDENYGENWAAWDAAVKNWLKENPDE